jgi:dTDP-4-dehydrorhamnose 3,5-epimerase-like enzyme
MPKVTVEAVRCSRDARGFVFEPIGAGLIAGQRNVHVAGTEPGAVRGNHYHRDSDELAIVPGPALVRFREAGQLRDVQVPEGEIHRFTIPAHVSHAFKNTGTKPMILVAFSSSEFKADAPDVFRDELI